jgi:AcrR family transcriptional regulator
MRARAASTAETRKTVLEASAAAFDELPFDEITLAEVARRSGVSVQTVIRHFGGKEGLFLATLQHTAAEMASGREVEPGGEPKEIVSTLIDHYEEFGDRVLHALAQEDRVPALGTLVELGRTYHLAWCRGAFHPALKGLRGRRRERRAFQLAAVTDIYMWKILRRDRGLGVAETKLAIMELLEPLLEPPG